MHRVSTYTLYKHLYAQNITKHISTVIKYIQDLSGRHSMPCLWRSRSFICFLGGKWKNLSWWISVVDGLLVVVSSKWIRPIISNFLIHAFSFEMSLFFALETSHLYFIIPKFRCITIKAISSMNLIKPLSPYDYTCYTPSNVKHIHFLGDRFDHNLLCHVEVTYSTNNKAFIWLQHRSKNAMRSLTLSVVWPLSFFMFTKMLQWITSRFWFLELDAWDCCLDDIVLR